MDCINASKKSAPKGAFLTAIIRQPTILLVVKLLVQVFAAPFNVPVTVTEYWVFGNSGVTG